MIGKELGHYRILEQLGEGGMGVIYRARDTHLDRTVVVKVLRPEAVSDPDRRRRFVQEAKAASALNHPNIVTIYDVDVQDGVDFIAMELIQGASLQERIPEEGLPVRLVLDYAVPMTSAIAAAHAAGIVHRDLKPANVMVTDSGQIKVLDFGLAKLTALDEGGDWSGSAPTAARTAAGVILGSIAYMSPEQAGGRAVDVRSDVFALGSVLYEMLGGRPPFGGPSALAILRAIQSEPALPLREVRSDVPPELDRIARICLEKEPSHRYASARELHEDLVRCRERLSGERVAVSSLLRARRVRAAWIAAGLVIVTAGGWWWSRVSGERWAREQLTEIERLVLEERHTDAFRLGVKVETYLASDSALTSLLDRASMPFRIETTPPVARVSYKVYLEPDAEWELLGETPMDGIRLPFTSLRFRIEKEGFEPVEASFAGVEPLLRFRLDAMGERPPDMVRVGEGTRRVLGSGVEIPDFFLDRREVTNADFQEFVEAGGYRNRDYWEHPFLDDGVELSFEEATARFVDATGRPGPATWELGAYPEGSELLPVTGVSWYEAAAYAAFAEKSLPTIHHWHHAAGVDYYSDILKLSNFGGEGPAAPGAFQGIGPYGTYDMAGNVKEWCFNATGDRRYVLGGAWNEPPYLFRDADAQSPMSRLPTIGFRCARYPASFPDVLSAAVETTSRESEKEERASDETFELFRSLYAYDASDLNAVVESVDDSLAYCRKEKITFDAAYGGERVIAWLFLPRSASPPYQTVVYSPSGEAFSLASSDYLGREWWLELVFRSGRALVHPVYQGTYERRVQGSGRNSWRDVILQQYKDLGRTLDYLETRPDLDASKIAYYGQSAGAEFAPIALALEPRFRAGILLWGGLDDRRRAHEVVEPVNFAPRVKAPVLMLNGRRDFIFPVTTSQLPLFRLFGSPDEDKRHVLFDYGHIPLRNEDVIREVLDWLDRYLGPVTPVTR